MKRFFGVVVLTMMFGVGLASAAGAPTSMIEPLTMKAATIQGSIRGGDISAASYGIGDLFDSGGVAAESGAVDARDEDAKASASSAKDRLTALLERKEDSRRGKPKSSVEELGPIAGAVDTTSLLYPVVRDVVDIMDKASKNVDAEGEKRAREGAEKQREAEKKWEGKERNYPQYQEKKK